MTDGFTFVLTITLSCNLPNILKERKLFYYVLKQLQSFISNTYKEDSDNKKMLVIFAGLIQISQMLFFYSEGNKSYLVLQISVCINKCK